MPNPVIRWQLVTPSPDASGRFLQQLFGWDVSRDNRLGYREVTAGAGGIDGGIWPSEPGQHPFVQLFIQVDDLDACLSRATALGATIVVPKSVLPDGDTMAVFLDPTGLTFGVCNLASTPPQQ